MTYGKTIQILPQKYLDLCRGERSAYNRAPTGDSEIHVLCTEISTFLWLPIGIPDIDVHGQQALIFFHKIFDFMSKARIHGGMKFPWIHSLVVSHTMWF